MQVAVDACETEIQFIIGAAMFERSDLLDVECGEWRILLMDLDAMPRMQ